MAQVMSKLLNVEIDFGDSKKAMLFMFRPYICNLNNRGSVCTTMQWMRWLLIRNGLHAGPCTHFETDCIAEAVCSLQSSARLNAHTDVFCVGDSLISFMRNIRR